MDKIIIKDVNETVFHETLSNGLNVYVYEKPGFDKKMAYFMTNYGSINNTFIPINESKMKAYPLGIAHFLEHKLFESEDNSNIFNKFEKNGAYVNAATGYDRTYYYFSCSDHFKENLELLVNFVQSPYFTDENVEKEKGIIAEEIDMCDDDQDTYLSEKVFENLFVKSPYKHSIAGTKESINKITKEDLYECYNTFYHPSNMYLTILGDVNAKEVTEFIKTIEKNKTFQKTHEIVQEKIPEPDSVSKENEEKEYNVVNKKLECAFKMVHDERNYKDDIKYKTYLGIYLDSLFGTSTDFQKEMIHKKIVKTYAYVFFDAYKNFDLITYDADVIDESALRNEIMKRFNNVNDLKELFEIYKRNYKAKFVIKYDILDYVARSINESLINYGKIIDDRARILDELNYDEYLKTIRSLNFKNVSQVVLLPKKAN